ncbi:MAG: hypothetical protein P4L59_19520 [Desulfosporosinus sp.]|nr:hypothetical protein [Desulfosporosinus sp.]
MKIIDLKDRFARSLVAGFFASLILYTLNIFSYYILHFSHRRYLNYAALMILGREFDNSTEFIVSSFAQICFATSLIVIFSYVILKEKRGNYLLRGLCIGIGTWFAILSICYIIGIHKILIMDIDSAISFLISSSIWGILGAWSLHKLDEQYDK